MSYTIGNLRADVNIVNGHMEKAGIDWRYQATRYDGGSSLDGHKVGSGEWTNIDDARPIDLGHLMYLDAFYRMSKRAQELNETISKGDQ